MGVARRLAIGDVGGRPDPDALAAFGLPQDFERPSDDLEVWPENEPAVRVFITMSTQWSTAGMGGQPVGLRYEVLPTVMRYCAIPPAERASTFAAVRIMERSALEAMQNGR